MKYTKEELEQADAEIANFYTEVISKLPATFAAPFTKPELALLRSFALYKNKLKGDAPTE